MVARMHATPSLLDELGLADLISREYMHHHRICPIGRADDGALIVGTTASSLLPALDELELATGHPIRSREMSAEEIERLIERLSNDADRTRLPGTNGEDAEESAADVRDLANQQPVRRYWALLTREAYELGASDIHLEMTASGMSVRLRRDGILVPAPEPPAGFHRAVVSLIKLEARLDIAESRRPQDGRIRVRFEWGELDLRVSTVPTMHGESVVLRLLDRGGRPGSLTELGMPRSICTSFERLARRPYGMILVTGPTGSGKTTTLYAALMLRSRDEEKIITVEDPVEYALPGVTQMPVHRGAGVTFANALRSILRQDPDVLMIGEMRDAETAEIAVQASMTGHLVFSTLHTNDSLAAIPRLIDLGVPPYLVAATLEGVLAQRLVRKTCDECRANYHPTAELLAKLVGFEQEIQTFQRGEGCAACGGTGYKGREGIYELLLVSDELRDAILHNASRAILRAAAENADWTPLRSDALRKVQDGITTVEEVLRVLS
jgi:type II secretory ATPase GspE/PulE/Tfp pilus assembly ATPase PilB-like protein